MAKILVLAHSGFGKSTSLGAIPELNIQGLNPDETFVITATSKPLPFRGSAKIYKVCERGKPPAEGNRIISNDGHLIARAINYVAQNRKEIKNIVIDDSNYIMQDYYMDNALKKGYDVFKEIGVFMNAIFKAMEEAADINFIMIAHPEEYRDSNLDTISYRYKTVGKMTADYITPEGKFDIVLFGKQSYDTKEKKVTKQFVTNYDGQYPAKSAPGMFEELYIPNDLGYVIAAVNEYYGEE